MLGTVVIVRKIPNEFLPAVSSTRGKFWLFIERCSQEKCITKKNDTTQGVYVYNPSCAVS